MMRKVLEKFKNKKVFALYLVGVLLLSTGISFAYFTARTNAEGEGGVATATTTTVTSQGITADGNIDFNNVDMYPGHTAIASIRVIGTGNNEPLIYNVIFNGTNTFNTPLEFTVYKSDANIDASYSCEIKQDRLGTSKIYYEECTGNNIENLGTPISSGTINNGEGKTTLKSDEIILTSPEGEEVYYYIVIEYPNLDANQNDDMGSSISGNITIEEGSEYQKPQVILTGSTTAGSNGWVQSASITANITTHTRKYEAYYCTTTSDSCTPNTPANISNNSFTTTLSSNASAQKVCVRVIDEYNQTTEGCSERYNVDTVNPTINITSTSVTENSISVTVSGSDAHSGISEYRFSSNGGSSYTTVTTSNSSYTYTFNNLESGTSYNIAVQAVDRSGRTSSTVTRSVTTEQAGILATVDYTLTSGQNPSTSTVSSTKTLSNLLGVERVEILSGGGTASYTLNGNNIVITARNGTVKTASQSQTCTESADLSYYCSSGDLVGSQCLRTRTAYYSYTCVQGSIRNSAWQNQGSGYTCPTPNVSCPNNATRTYSTEVTCTRYTSASASYSCDRGTLEGSVCSYDCSYNYNYYEYQVRVTYYHS